MALCQIKEYLADLKPDDYGWHSPSLVTIHDLIEMVDEQNTKISSLECTIKSFNGERK